MTAVQEILLLVIVITFSYKIINFLIQYWKFLQVFKSVPGPQRPRKAPKEITEEFMLGLDLLKQYPRLHLMWRGPFTPRVCVHHPDTIKPILKDGGIKRGSASNYHRMTLLYNSLICLDTNEIKDERLKMEEFLKDERRFQYRSLISDLLDNVMGDIPRLADSTKTIDVYPWIDRLALDIHLNVFFSWNPNNRFFKATEFQEIEAKLMALYIRRNLKWYLYPDVIFFMTPSGIKDLLLVRKMRSLVKVLVDRKSKQQHTKGMSACKDLFEYIVSGRKKISALCDNAVELLVERRGIVTGSNWTLYYLAKYPQYQKIIRNELRTLFDDEEKMRKDIRESDFQQLSVTNMFMKEVLRICPPTPHVERTITKETCIDGITFPAGTSFYVNINGLHHNELLWDAPNDFNPERFKNNTAFDVSKYAPFSAYSRRCVAKNFATECITMIVARILQRYELSMDKDFVVSKRVDITQNPSKLPLIFSPIF